MRVCTVHASVGSAVGRVLLSPDVGRAVAGLCEPARPLLQPKKHAGGGLHVSLRGGAASALKSGVNLDNRGINTVLPDTAEELPPGHWAHIVKSQDTEQRRLDSGRSPKPHNFASGLLLTT